MNNFYQQQQLQYPQYPNTMNGYPQAQPQIMVAPNAMAPNMGNQVPFMQPMQTKQLKFASTLNQKDLDWCAKEFKSVKGRVMSFEIPDKLNIQARCNHQSEKGFTLIFGEDGDCECSVCHQTFQFKIPDIDELNQAVKVLQNGLRVAKTLNTNNSPAVVQFYELDPLLNKIPEFCEYALRNGEEVIKQIESMTNQQTQGFGRVQYSMPRVGIIDSINNVVGGVSGPGFSNAYAAAPMQPNFYDPMMAAQGGFAQQPQAYQPQPPMYQHSAFEQPQQPPMYQQAQQSNFAQPQQGGAWANYNSQVPNVNQNQAMNAGAQVFNTQWSAESPAQQPAEAKQTEPLQK